MILKDLMNSWLLYAKIIIKEFNGDWQDAADIFQETVFRQTEIGGGFQEVVESFPDHLLVKGTSAGDDVIVPCFAAVALFGRSGGFRQINAIDFFEVIFEKRGKFQHDRIKAFQDFSVAGEFIIFPEKFCCQTAGPGPECPFFLGKVMLYG